MPAPIVALIPWDLIFKEAFGLIKKIFHIDAEGGSGDARSRKLRKWIKRTFAPILKANKVEMKDSEINFFTEIAVQCSKAGLAYPRLVLEVIEEVRAFTAQRIAEKLAKLDSLNDGGDPLAEYAKSLAERHGSTLPLETLQKPGVLEASPDLQDATTGDVDARPGNNDDVIEV